MPMILEFNITSIYKCNEKRGNETQQSRTFHYAGEWNDFKTFSLMP